MGLYVHSLENIPDTANRDYFIYLLDYGWEGDSLSEALDRNYNRMARLAAQNKAVVIKGTSEHFQDEVFSWHSINGLNGDHILPAILITNQVPSSFRNISFDESKKESFYQENENLKLILIPLKKFCNNSDDVISMINQIFDDITQQKDLSGFEVLRQIKKEKRGSRFDSIILQPNFYGLGIDLKKLFGIKEK